MSDPKEPYSVTGRVEVQPFVFDKPRAEFIESIGPECAHMGKELFTALIREYDHRSVNNMLKEVVPSEEPG